MFPWSFSVFNCTSCTNQFEALKSPRGQFDTGTVKSLHQITCVLSFNMEVLKGREFTFTSRWLRRKGPQEKHYTWSCLSPKKLVIKSNLGWAFEHPILVWKGGVVIWTNQSSKVKMLGGFPEGGKGWWASIDWCVSPNARGLSWGEGERASIDWCISRWYMFAHLEWI